VILPARKPEVFTATLTDMGNAPFYFTERYKDMSMSILNGRYASQLLGLNPRKILDLGAGCGAFAVWCYKMWPYAWVYCEERDEFHHDLCQKNLGPGGRMVQHWAEGKDYDIVRFGVGMRGATVPKAKLYLNDNVSTY